jgi:hypothetical protein
MGKKKITEKLKDLVTKDDEETKADKEVVKEAEKRGKEAQAKEQTREEKMADGSFNPFDPDN